MRRAGFLLTPILLLAWGWGKEASAQFKPVPGLGDTANLHLSLRRAGFTGSVLQITAHPDDENHGALTYLSRHLGARVGLLTLTHGGAFGNALDERVGVALGVLRTQELLAADKYYGVDQFFTRATDSGTVKDGSTALRLWGHDAVLEDVVRVIRFFRPDVIINRWQGNERDGHGHHAAAALLTQEAFRAAADPTRFPEQIAEGLAPWQAKKLYMDWLTDDQQASVEIDAGDYDPVLGSSYAELGAQGLSLQRSQIQRLHAWPGPAVYRFHLIEPFSSDPQKEHSLFEGLETTLPGLSQLAGKEEKRVPWLRPALEDAHHHWQTALSGFRANAPHEIASHLLAALDILKDVSHRIGKSRLSSSALYELQNRLERKIEDFEDAAARSLGLRLEAFVGPQTRPRETLVPGVGGAPPAPPHIVPGQNFTVTVALWNRSPDAILVESCGLDGEARWTIGHREGETTEIGYNEASFHRFSVHVPEDAEYTQPAWGRVSYHAPLNYYRKAGYQLLPRRPPVLLAACRYRAHGVEASQRVPVQVRTYDRLHGEQEEWLKVVPPVAVEVHPRRRISPLNANGRELSVEVTVRNQLPGTLAGEIRLELPPGWTSLPARHFQLKREGEVLKYHFAVQLPEHLPVGEWQIQAVASVGGKNYTAGYDRIAYPQLEPQHLYHPARMNLSVVDARLADSLRVGYVAGRGGDQPITKVIGWLGADSRLLNKEFSLAHLQEFDTVILGPFTFSVNPELRAAVPDLTKYVEDGGVVIALPYAVADPVIPYPVQPRKGAAGWGPYPYRLPGNVFEGVVDPQAAVEILAPDHPVFDTPNRISVQDFANWISALAAGTPIEWDSHYQPLLQLREVDGREMQGSLLMARHGQGLLVYAALTLHTQLHVSNPGAVRLLANLVSLPRTLQTSNSK